MRFQDAIKKAPQQIKYIALLFLTTRFALSVVGVASRRWLDPVFHYYHPDWVFSKNMWLDLWGVFDTGWYISIAAKGYPAQLVEDVSNYGFFPLYSILISIINAIIQNYYFAALIISNIFLIIACIYCYKLVHLIAGEAAALRSIKYIFIFPAGFILSAAFSESLFLAFMLMCFYYAKKEQWLYAGIAGFFLALTKAIGLLIVIPLFYEYLTSKQFKLSKIRLDILSIALLPLGTLSFATFCYLRTGNFFAYTYTKQIGWKMKMGNPLHNLYLCFQSNSHTLLYNAIFIVALILILTIFIKRIGISYWLVSMTIIVVTLMYGKGNTILLTDHVSTVPSFIRYSSAIFPIYILLAMLGENRYVDEAMTWFLAILQGFIVAFWAAALNITI
ncbi:MAG: glycosyltransferase family 39 protein [Candidatus Omnitrophica bacterium]|nr:glycosyltransferase family 39 protein [Candidatus Omnitrophota bacterium]